MKVKTKIIILVSVCLVILVGALIGDRILGKSYLNEIKADEVIKMMENKEDFILVISKTTCSYCNEYKPKLERIAKEYKIDMYYIQVDLIDEDDKEKFNSYFSYSGTPETVFIRNGEERTAASRINGNASIEKIKTKLKANGWIKE